MEACARVYLVEMHLSSNKKNFIDKSGGKRNDFWYSPEYTNRVDCVMGRLFKIKDRRQAHAAFSAAAAASLTPADDAPTPLASQANSADW
jgi:hypothetical protein